MRIAPGSPSSERAGEKPYSHGSHPGAHQAAIGGRTDSRQQALAPHGSKQTPQAGGGGRHPPKLAVMLAIPVAISRAPSIVSRAGPLSAACSNAPVRPPAALQR